MSDEINSPLLSLIHGQGLIDDLQYEEVAGELKRNATPAMQVLQDFGIMKLDDILHVVATALGTEVVSLKDKEIPATVLALIPSKIAQMYKCLPVALVNGALQVAVAEPLNPQIADEIQFPPSVKCRLSWLTRRRFNAALNGSTARRKMKVSPRSSRS